MTRIETAAGGCPAGRPEPMALDHRRLLATALGRLRGKLKYRPVVFELLPPTFTLLQLQRVVEALAGVPAAQAELPPPGRDGRPGRGHRGASKPDRGRPAELFRFRREVLRERRAPGVGLPRRTDARQPSRPALDNMLGLVYWCPRAAGCPAF